jgi:peptide-methionine (S)-S-oxide reductase
MKSEKLLLAVVVLGVGVAVAFYLGGMSMKPDSSTPAEAAETPAQTASSSPAKPDETPPGMAKATFAGGCFWCTEAVFLQLRGVESVVSGYTGGTVKNPTYRQVCNGDTGHAEAIQITYNPAEIGYEDLLDVFWQTHDPTTLNRQGNDEGTQYRSAIFYHTDEQKQIAERSKKKLDESGKLASRIVTEIVPATVFYPAEDYHQNYFENNSRNGYCQLVIPPKLAKLKKGFADKLKGAAKK